MVLPLAQATSKKKRAKNWKAALRAVGDNPDYIFQQIEALKKELKKDYPYVPYLYEKVRNINKWVGEIDKFA